MRIGPKISALRADFLIDFQIPLVKQPLNAQKISALRAEPSFFGLKVLFKKRIHIFLQASIVFKSHPNFSAQGAVNGVLILTQRYS